MQNEHGNSRVFLQDCMELMKQYPDGYFDLAVTDPPYGIQRSGQKETFTVLKKHKRKQFNDKGWDKAAPSEDYFKELFRVSKNQVVWGANYFTQHLPPSMGWIFWDKGQDLTMSDGELAFTSFQKALRRIIINRSELVRDGGTIHPTQKPIKLYDWIFQNYAKQGNKILDTHLGSGSSRIAAWKHGLDFTGCELDTEYYEASIKRFEDHIKQLTLF
jgi:site-specific DNA-methyltransferase (adenine-specific)